MTIIFRILTTLIFLVSTPFIALGVIVVGLVAIWGKPKDKAVVKPVESQGVGEPKNPAVTAPIDWNTVPVGRMDKGGAC